MAGFWEAKVVSVVTTINGYRHTRGGRTRFADSYQMLRISMFKPLQEL